MKQCPFLTVTAALLLGAAAKAQADDAPKSASPNFLIIFIDDMGYGDPSCYGNTAARTPHIDQLAKDGTRFTSFYAQTVCGPSRGALMTGRYPHRVGGGWTTNAEEVFISEILQEAGYTTGCVGKWDMSRRRYQEALVPNSQGFDFYFGTLGANDANRVTLWHNRKKLETTEDMAGLTRLYTDKSIAFLEEHGENDKPFFLYLAHTMMHVVIDASPEFRDRTGEGLYADTLEELDHEIGRLLAKLDELGLRDNTLVLFTSDNGPWSNDHARQRAKNAKYVEWTKGPKIPWGSAGPLRGAKGSTWEGGVRVPGIVRWPDQVPAGRTSDAIVSTLDVLPTFAALAGVEEKVPTDRKIDGGDQRALFLGNETGARDQFLYYEQSELLAVRKGPWKLRLPGLKKLRDWPEMDRGTQVAELYHLGRDLGEKQNVASDHPDVVQRLTRLAERLRRDLGNDSAAF
jgi:arylsulfatase A-like enzyme